MFGLSKIKEGKGKYEFGPDIVDIKRHGDDLKEQLLAIRNAYSTHFNELSTEISGGSKYATDAYDQMEAELVASRDKSLALLQSKGKGAGTNEYEETAKFYSSQLKKIAAG